MNVFGLSTTKPPYTNPFPEKSATEPKNGVILRLLGGDVVRPLNGKWLEPPFPTRVVYWRCPVPILPFVGFRFGRFKGYLGFKCFGLGHDQYREWMKGAETGGYALTPSARFSNGEES